MEDKKLIRLCANEIKMMPIIYDNRHAITPRHGNRKQLIKNAFETVCQKIKEKDDSYFWLKG